MSTPEPYFHRLTLLRRAMIEDGLDGLLIVRPENRMYLSGYSALDTQIDESSGCILVLPDSQYLLTDFRYLIQAKTEAQGYEIVQYASGPFEPLSGLLNRHSVKRLGFEDDLVTVRFHRQLKETINITLQPAAGLVELLRARKDQAEIKALTSALNLTEKALAQTFAFLEVGRSEIEVARFLDRTMEDMGASGPAFETIVASGPNAALPHAVPTSRKIRAGETIIFDCGARLQNYNADISRTIVLGEPTSLIKKIYLLVRKAQLAAIQALKPGLMTDEADQVARKIIDAQGYGPFFGHGLGHGVGLATHESPSLSQRRPQRLEPGMVVTVEPGIYLEGQCGVRLEQMVLITEENARVLNSDETFYDWR